AGRRRRCEAGRARTSRRRTATAAAHVDTVATREAEEETTGATLSGVEIEATGETVGEAKWAALRELEKQQPGVDKSAVRFQVVSEGERGLLGVGYAPARVIATVDAEASRTAHDESPLAAEVRELLERIVDAIGVAGRAEVH